MQVLTRTRNAHVEQPAFLFNLLITRLNRVRDRQGVFHQADEEDRVPLQALRGVQAGKGHTIHRRWLLRLGALAQRAQHTRQVIGLLRVHNLFDQIHQRTQCLPTLTRLNTLRLLRGQTKRGERCTRHLHRVIRQVAAVCGARQLVDGLADLTAVEKALTAADLVQNARVCQCRFKGRGLRVDAIQHGDFAGRHTVIQQAADCGGYLAGLRRLIIKRRIRRLRARLAHTNQLKTSTRCASCGLANHRVRQIRDLRGGTVVTLQLHHRGVLIGTRKVQQKIRGRAGKRVDGLVGIAHHRQIIALAQPTLQHTLLQRGHVLVLIHHKRLVLGAELLRHRRCVL